MVAGVVCYVWRRRMWMRCLDRPQQYAHAEAKLPHAREKDVQLEKRVHEFAHTEGFAWSKWWMHNHLCELLEHLAHASFKMRIHNWIR
jgi:hypothetical protein